MPLRPASRVAPAATAARRVTLAVLATATLAACGDDPFQQEAQFDTEGTVAIVYPLSQASAELPAAIDFTNLRSVRPGLRASSGAPNFDVALDLDGNTLRVLLPQYVVVPVTGVPRIGAQMVPGGFDDVTLAPEKNFRYDTVTVAAVGQTVVVQTPGLNCNSSAPNVAKFVVDSVVGSSRAMYVRIRFNPNCGFRSLAPGRPEE